MNDKDEDPLWKQVWKTDGIRYLGPDGNGVIDAMERFRHAFELGMAHANTCTSWDEVRTNMFPEHINYNNRKNTK